MTTLFAICAAVGAVWLVLEAGAKAGSVAPSMYRTSGNGWILILIGVIGAICASYLP
jgi:uncharacterized membrane protein YeaQ/YmgE (transglycosylase-associated protein family)